VSKLKAKPFALIGVNVTGHDAKQLKEVMATEGLTWRSFADPGDLGRGAIAARWNLAATPTLYVIDPEGVIRHKWVGATGQKVVDEALETLIQQAEDDQGRPAPR
jgi:peroxiredoxin